MNRDLFLGLVIGIFAAVIVALGWYTYDRSQNGANVPETVVNETSFEFSDPITVQERINEWVFQKEVRQYENAYYELDPGTLQLILEKLGAEVSLVEIVKEYQNNSSYYFTKSAMRKIDGFIEEKAPKEIPPTVDSIQ